MNHGSHFCSSALQNLNHRVRFCSAAASPRGTLEGALTGTKNCDKSLHISKCHALAVASCSAKHVPFKKKNKIKKNQENHSKYNLPTRQRTRDQLHMTDGRIVLETGWIIRSWVEKIPVQGENRLEYQFENNKLTYITKPQTDCFSDHTGVVATMNIYITACLPWWFKSVLLMSSLLLSL